MLYRENFIFFLRNIQNIYSKYTVLSHLGVLYLFCTLYFKMSLCIVVSCLACIVVLVLRVLL